MFDSPINVNHFFMAETNEETRTEVRWSLPDDIYNVIKKHRRLLIAHLDKDFTHEEAFIHFMRALDIPNDLHLKEQKTA